MVGRNDITKGNIISRFQNKSIAITVSGFITGINIFGITGLNIFKQNIGRHDTGGIFSAKSIPAISCNHVSYNDIGAAVNFNGKMIPIAFKTINHDKRTAGTDFDSIPRIFYRKIFKTNVIMAFRIKNRRIII